MLFRIANHIIRVSANRLIENEEAISDHSPDGIEYHRYLEIICPCGCNEVAGILKQEDPDNPCGEVGVWMEAYETRGWG